MSQKPHLQIFNESQATCNNESNFPLFPLLPKELRLKIWQHSLQRNRIIKVFLRAEKLFNTEQPATQTTDSIASTSKSERYRAYVNGYQVLSKLLRVNAEAREAALGFYRVHIPCWLKVGETYAGFPPESLGILYFNPEYDFLHISSEVWAEDTLVDFLYHLRTTYDPHHVGLLNLAVDFNGLNVKDLFQLEPSKLDPRVREAFVETLTQLREVFLVSEQAVGRQIHKYFGFITDEPFFNRSLPILGSAVTFQRLHRDPRPIAQDLRRMSLAGSDPRQTLHIWQQLLNKFGVIPPQIEYRVCLSCVSSSSRYRIYDHQSAERWLQFEDDHWTRANRGPGRDQGGGIENDRRFLSWAFGRLWKEKRTASVSGKNKNEDIAKAVQSAFGFWLFPIEVLDAEDFPYSAHDLFDMSAYWPELGLSSLPQIRRE
jgi:hypothetical protein